MQYCRKEPDDNDITDFKSFKFKSTFANNVDKDGTGNLEITLRLKYLIHFWKTLEMPLINCEISLDLTWFEDCVICEADSICNEWHKPLCSISDNTKLL